MSAGNVVNVVETLAGSELAADAAAAATSITVEDPTDFQPDGGDLLIGAQEVAYSTVDEDTGVITLDAPLAASHLAEDIVIALPETSERFAFVQLEDQEETLQARVPHALYDRLDLGQRDPNLDDPELVEVVREPDGELIVADVLNRPPTVDGAYIEPGTIDPAGLDLTDGLAPVTSPTPTVLGGVLSLFVTWVPVANPDPVTYEVHVSTSSGFTPGVGTFAGEVRGTIFVIRALPGTTNPPAYGTTYYVKLIAKDDDGAAAASAEDSAAPEEGTVGAIIVGMLAANSVLAENLQAVLVMASTMIAGTPGAGRLEFGIADPDGPMAGMIGLHAFDEDGTTLTFMLDAETGQVYVRGRLDFGTGSRLLADDIVELQEQSSASFQTPALVQSSSALYTNAASPKSVTWPGPTSKGNTLLLSVLAYDETGTPTITTPSGWTLVGTVVNPGALTRLSVYKIENAAARSGAQAVAWTTGAAAIALQLFEYSGVGVQDVAAATATGVSGTGSTGTTGTTTQAEELWLGFIGWLNQPASSAQSPTNGFVQVRHDVAGWTGLAAFRKNVVAVGTAQMSVTMPNAPAWLGLAVTFKAKVAGVVAPDVGKVRIYGLDVNGEATLHVRDEANVENSVALAPAAARWRFEHVTVTVNIPSTAAHSGGGMAVSIPGLAIGDLAILMGLDASGGNQQQMHRIVEPVCATAGQVHMRYFNADTVTVDPSLGTYEFLVIHRS